MCPPCNGRPAIAHDFVKLAVGWGVTLRFCEHCGVMEVGPINGGGSRYFVPWNQEKGT
jgi:hypothetical protein